MKEGSRFSWTEELWFVGLSYGISWSIWLLPVGSPSEGLTLRVSGLSLAIPWRVLTLVLGNLGPGIAAIVLTYYFDDADGLIKTWRRFLLSRADLKWCLLAVLAPLVLTASSLWVLNVAYFSAGSTLHWLRVFFLNILLAPLWEEMGWRGYLLPRLQLNRDGLSASLLLAPIWGFWHVPLYWGTGLNFIGCFACYIVGGSVVFTWFYNKTSGNLAVVALLHAAANASTISLLGPAMSLQGIKPFLLLTILVSAIAIGIVALAGTNLSFQNGISRAES
jgi:uncharacterized protein